LILRSDKSGTGTIREYRQYFIYLLFLAIAAGSISAGSSSDGKPDFAGVDRCKKCHQRDNIYQSWSKSAHASAWLVLNEEQRKDKSCISCHSTGENAKGELLTSVQCESCHGPGRDHQKLLLTESKDEAKKSGKVYIDEHTCRKCHNDDIPPQFRPEKPFDYNKALATGVHDFSGNIKHEMAE